jgi:hypothetical protein
MGGSPDTPEQSDPEVEEKKAKRKALALSQAYEAKTAALGMSSTQLYGKKRNETAAQPVDREPAEKTPFPLWGSKKLFVDLSDGTLKPFRDNKGQQKKTALSGLKTHVPQTGDRETAAAVYRQQTGNARSRLATEMNYRRRKRNSQALEVG